MTLPGTCKIFLLPVWNKTAAQFILRKVFLEKLSRRFSTESSVENVSQYKGVVGLEVHAQINSQSKLFSSSPVTFGFPTNTKVSYFDAALPGTLPVLNKHCVEAGILTALACNCTVNKISTFDRKHYFYPDLPTGYQITQQFHPLASDGHIKFIVHDKEKDNGGYQCCAFLKQLQLEQDSGRSFHMKGKKSLVDLNRAGIGLMELVFEPNLKNGTEAAALVKELICILRRLGTCSCEMEEGTLRVDANISVNKVGDPLGVRTEVKNINSLRFIARAIDFEIKRQIQVIENGGVVVNETRAYDYNTKTTVFMRDKEMLQDYRFMPEPNLPPIHIHDEHEIIDSVKDGKSLNLDDLRKQLPVFPEIERCKLVEHYQVPLNIADKLVHSEGLRAAFETIASIVDNHQFICHFLLNNVQSILNARKLSLTQCELSSLQIAELIQLLLSRKISDATANDILEMFFNGEQRPAKEIIETYNWYLITDDELDKVCSEVLMSRLKLVKKYKKSGRKHDMNTLVTAVGQKVNNRVRPKDAEAVLKRLIMNLEFNKNT